MQENFNSIYLSNYPEEKILTLNKNRYYLDILFQEDFIFKVIKTWTPLTLSDKMDIKLTKNYLKIAALF